MRRETTIAFSALILGGGSLLLGLDTVTVAALSILSIALGSVLTPPVKKNVDEDYPEVFYPDEVIQEGQLKHPLQKVYIKTLTLKECESFSKILSKKLHLQTESKYAALQVLNQIITQYVNCMVDTFILEPEYLSQYELEKLQYMLHIALVYIKLESISNTIPSKIISDSHNIENINKLILLITEAIFDKRQYKDCFAEKSYVVLEYLKNLATQSHKKDLENHIQETMDYYWKVTPVDLAQSPQIQDNKKSRKIR